MRTVEVLGPVRVAGEPLTSSTQATLLAVLAAAQPEAVPFHRLIDAVWDEPPPSAENSLHSHLARLRRRLGPGAVQREGGAYRLVSPTDAGELAAVVADAGGDPATRRRRLRAAVGRWRGAPFGELGGHRFVRAAVDAITTAYRRAVHELADGDLAAADPSSAVARLQDLVTKLPLDEETWARLVEALQASGRTAEALRAVQAAIAALAEVGLEPSARLAGAERAVLHAAPPTPTPAPLPRAARPLIGRDDMLARLAALLSRPGWSTLLGPGGVGKTSLAIEATARTGGPAVFCALTDTAADDVTVVLARAAGVPFRPPYIDRVATMLAQRRPVLVLDACETVCSAVATLGVELLARCPDLRVVATSRAPVGVPGERLIEVAPLAPEHAVELFARRVDEAGMAAPSAGVVDALCRAVDGLPLTIETLAGSYRSLSGEELLAALADPLRVLGGPEGDLASSVGRSVELLDDDERRSFERLSMFHGPFVLDTAQHVLGDGEHDPRPVAHLRALRDRSLLSTVDTESGRRLVMLDTVRAVGRHARRGRPDADEDQRRFLTAFARRAVEIDAGLRTRDELRWLGAATAETVDLRAAHRLALATGDVDVASTIAARMFHLVYDRLRPDVAAWADDTIDRFGDDRPLAATVRAVAALGAMHVDRHDRSWIHIEQGRRLAGRPDRHVELVAANLALRTGELTASMESALAVVDAAAEAGDAYTESVGYVLAALCTGYRGEVAPALELAQRARTLSRRVGAPTLLAYADYVEGEIHSETDPDVALELLRRAYDRAAASASALAEGVALVTITTIRARSTAEPGHDGEFRTAIEHWRALGDWNLQWATLRNYAEYLGRTGRDELAVTVFGTVDVLGTEPFGPEAGRVAAVRAALQARLGAARYERLLPSGRTLTGDELLDRISDDVSDTPVVGVRRSP